MVGGYMNDVNNSIAMGDVYSFDDFPVDIGTPDSGLSDTAPTNDVLPNGGVMGSVPTNTTMSQSVMVSPLGKPAMWWLALFGMFGIFIWLSRRYGGGDKFTNIRASAYNLFFLTVFVILMSNFLRVIAAHWNIPGFSAMLLNA